MARRPGSNDMNTMELAEKLSPHFGIPKRALAKLIRSIFAEIAYQNGKGRRVEVTGFATFKPKILPEKDGVTPQGDGITIPKRRSVNIKKGAMFRLLAGEIRDTKNKLQRRGLWWRGGTEQ